jgi:hypothetical protein
MAIRAREPRICRGCGYRFTPWHGEQWFCSTICEGAAGMASVIAGVRQFARAQGCEGSVWQAASRV